jgi:hypothetical protein
MRQDIIGRAGAGDLLDRRTCRGQFQEKHFFGCAITRKR